MFLFCENDKESESDKFAFMHFRSGPKSINFSSVPEPDFCFESSVPEVLTRENKSTLICAEIKPIENPISIDRKREGARIRSRRTHERKKQYIQELKSRISFLQKENAKLRNEFERFQSDLAKEDCKNQLLSSYSLDNFKNVINQSFKGVIEKDSNPTVNFEEFFQTNSQEIIQSHGEVIDKAFKFMIENIIPKFRQKYFKLIDEPLNLSYEDIKRYSKLTKYQQAEFHKEISPSQLDELLLRFKPNKRQFNFITKVQNPNEKEIKTKIK